MRERKKDFAGPFHKMYGISSGLTAMIQKNDIISGLFANKESNNNNSNVKSNYEEYSIRNSNNRFVGARDFSPEHL